MTRSPSHRAGRLPGLALAVVVAAGLVAGCGTSGRTMKAPEPGATAPPRSTSTTAGSAIGPAAPAGLTISSSAWIGGGDIPVTFTCDGEDVSPPLQLDGVPDGAAELVLLVTDPSADGFVHWAVAGIDPITTFWPQDTEPAGAVTGTNGAGGTGWTGPCPPAGETHTYDFTLYALASPSGLAEGFDPISLVDATVGAVSTAAMTGTYTRS